MDRCYCCDITTDEIPSIRIVERNGEFLCEECFNSIEENLDDLAINDEEETIE